MNQLDVCPSTLQKGYKAYSPAALRRLFDGQQVSHILPYHSIEDAGIRALFNDGRRRLSLSGAQSKYPVVADGGVLRICREGERGTHILKPCLVDYANASFSPANEHLTMQIAEQAYGITTAASGLCFFQDGTPAYLTRRYDIAADGQRIQQEDFASLAGITADTHGRDYKYNALSYEDIANIIQRHLTTWRIDMMRYYDMVMFNYLFSNGDAHLKNFSALRRPDGDYGLAPAYDLINTQIHIPDDSPFALARGLFAGEDQHKELNMDTGYTFLSFGLQIGLSRRVVKKEWERFAAHNDKVDELVANSFLSDRLKNVYLEKYEARRRRLAMLTGERELQL